jgi:hypothetical protein
MIPGKLPPSSVVEPAVVVVDSEGRCRRAANITADAGGPGDRNERKAGVLAEANGEAG